MISTGPGDLLVDLTSVSEILAGFQGIDPAVCTWRFGDPVYHLMFCLLLSYLWKGGLAGAGTFLDEVWKACEICVANIPMELVKEDSRALG